MFVSGNGDMTDVPDQYDGLMMTEFFRNFSSSEDINPHPLQNEDINPLQTEDINPLQTEDINPLQNNMGLHNGEVKELIDVSRMSMLCTNLYVIYSWNIATYWS